MERYLTGSKRKIEDQTKKHPIKRQKTEVPGFYLFHDFVTEEEEKDMLRQLDSEQQEWESSRTDKNRRIQVLFLCVLLTEDLKRVKRLTDLLSMLNFGQFARRRRNEVCRRSQLTSARASSSM